MAHRAVVYRPVEEVMANHLMPQGRKGVRSVGRVTPVQALPIDEVCATHAALPALVRRHLLQLFEAV
jgi:hypothetical protein